MALHEDTEMTNPTEPTNRPQALIAGPHIRVAQTRHGLMLYNVNDRYVGRSFELYGEFSAGETELFRQIIRPGATVVDAGANIGAHTVFFARSVGPSGLVLAFEPQRLIFQMLCANLALNELENVHALHLALGEASGRANIPVLGYATQENFGGVGLTGEALGEEVEMLPLDRIDFERLDFMKIDVEGLETSVIKGARTTIARHRPLIYAENDRREHSPELIELLGSLNYQLYWHLPPLFSPANFYGNQENAFKGLVSGNVLAVPRELGASIEGLRPVNGPQDWPI